MKDTLFFNITEADHGTIALRKGKKIQSLKDMAFEDALKDSSLQKCAIIPSDHIFLREVSLPAKSKQQFGAMLPHQIEKFIANRTKKTRTCHEYIFNHKNLKQPYSAIVLTYDVSALSQQLEGLFHSKTSMISEHMALFHAYAELLFSQDTPSHIFHYHNNRIHHLFQIQENVIHMNISYVEEVDLLDSAIKKLKHSHHWAVPNKLKCGFFGYHEKDIRNFQESIDTTCLNLSLPSSSHQDLLIKGALAFYQNPRGESFLSPNTTNSYERKGSQNSAWNILGAAVLFCLGCIWIGNTYTIKKREHQSQQLLSQLKKIHQKTMIPGQRRSFSEMSLFRRLSIDAKKVKHPQNKSISFISQLQKIQGILSQSPEFNLDRIQSRPTEGRLQLQGSVRSVQDFDNLTHSFENKKDWEVQSNFTRSKGKDLKLNLSLEPTP